MAFAAAWPQGRSQPESVASGSSSRLRRASWPKRTQPWILIGLGLLLISIALLLMHDVFASSQWTAFLRGFSSSGSRVAPGNRSLAQATAVAFTSGRPERRPPGRLDRRLRLRRRRRRGRADVATSHAADAARVQLTETRPKAAAKFAPARQLCATLRRVKRPASARTVVTRQRLIARGGAPLGVGIGVHVLTSE